MYTDKLNVTEYSTNPPRTYRVELNAFHINISTKERETVFARTPDMDEWFDEDHQKICKALRDLEFALLETIRKHRR
jgi:hypothetical protein